jgi:GDPmannose 4,6-dehydratase
MPNALIWGIAGQDGHYLAKLLIESGYAVVGVDHRARELPDLVNGVEVRVGNLADQRSLEDLLGSIDADEIYNFASVSSIQESLDDPRRTLEVNGLGVVRLLKAIDRVYGDSPQVRFCQASSSQMFGTTAQRPQDEETPFRPNNPYAVAKAIAHHATSYFRRYRGTFASSAILFNHESPLRKERFVSRRISKGVARIKLGSQDALSLDNLDGRRDWGFAGDYARAMHTMLQKSKPGDYVIATGEAHSVRDFVDLAFRHVGIPEWQPFVRVENDRPNVDADMFPLGDPSKARRELGWMPLTSFEELVTMMVEHDLELEGGRR